jgi:hypothetical protein
MDNEIKEVKWEGVVSLSKGIKSRTNLVSKILWKNTPVR